MRDSFSFAGVQFQKSRQPIDCATFARVKVKIFFAKSVLRKEPQKVSMVRALKEKNFEF